MKKTQTSNFNILVQKVLKEQQKQKVPKQE